MDRLKETLYDILGVSRDAKVTDIGRAYNRHRSAMRQETTPPDARRAALLHEAFEVLSDPQKRAAYDASLRRSRALVLPGGKPLGPSATAALLVLAALSVIVVLFILNRPAARKSPKLLTEVRTAASLAVGRLQSVGVSGKAQSAGLAFTLEQGVMVTPCAGLSPDAELVVLVPPRKIPARVIGADPTRRFCRLEVAGAGSWPLMINSFVPKPGEKVYAADMAANGEIVLSEGSIKGVRDAPGGRIVETSLPVAADASGRPLLDPDGHVIAAAVIAADGKGQYVSIPSDWIDARKPKAKPDEPPPEPEPPAKTDLDGKPLRDPAANISPERRQRLEKAFRPPPTVPDDI